MDNSASVIAAARDASGRFLPGQSGNPAGKRPGTRNRATLIREALRGDEEMALARAVIDKATAGDTVSARFLLGLLCPRPLPRGRAIALELPEGARAGDTVAAFNATLLAMAAGEITPDEALTITRVFDGRLQALRAWELERHMIAAYRETIPGDDLFAPEDEQDDEYEEEDEDEAEDEAEPAVVAAAPGPSTTLRRSSAQDEGSPALATNSPHPELPALAGKSKDMGPEQDPAASPEHLHSACIEQAQEAETAAFLAAQRKLAQWSHLLAQQPGFNADAYLKAEVAATLSAARR